MTIQGFSERTGLPASTLRYYEKEGLLQPSFIGRITGIDTIGRIRFRAP
ncbi:MerR family DNA-binding transcriptional regulator [Paenibacillus sp. LHD-117]